MNNMVIAVSDRIKQVEEYYFSRKLAEVNKLGTASKPVINLGIGSPDLPPDDSTIEALVTSARCLDHHAYQGYRGLPTLREAIADFYSKVFAVSLDAGQEILPLMGSKEGIFHICMAFVNEGEEVLVANPGYPTYASAAKLAGAKVVTYDLREETDWGIDLEALRQHDFSNTKLMFVNSPHMPTGRVATHDELQALVAMAKEHQFLLVSDNPYSLVLNDKPASILAIPGARDVCVELNSLSKSHNMAGWRVGWVAGSGDYINAILRVKSNMDSGMFRGLQDAAITALSQGTAWFEKLNATYSKRRQCVFDLLDVLDCSYTRDQSGMFVWAKAPVGVADVGTWIDEILYATHVFITPGFIFGDNGKQFIRISLCANEHNFHEAITRVKAWKKEQGVVQDNQMEK